MMTRVPLVSMVAAWLGVFSLVSLLPRIGDLLFGPAIFHPVPSTAGRIFDGARDLLLCVSLVLAFLLWLHRRRVRYILLFTCCAIGLISLVLPCCSRSIFSYPVFDPVAIALRDATPWFFFAALLCHPSVVAAFGQPVPVRFSVRFFLISAVVHIALFVTVEAVSIIPYAVRDVLETFLLLPAKILLGLFVHFGAGSIVLDSAVWATAGPVLMIPLSALVWGCLMGLIRPRGPREDVTPKPSNQAMQRTAGRSAAKRGVN